MRADELDLPRSAGTGSRCSHPALRLRLPAARDLQAAMKMTTSTTNDRSSETKFDGTIFPFDERILARRLDEKDGAPGELFIPDNAEEESLEASVASLLLTTEAVNMGVQGGPSRQAAA